MRKKINLEDANKKLESMIKDLQRELYENAKSIIILGTVGLEDVLVWSKDQAGDAFALLKIVSSQFSSYADVIGMYNKINREPKKYNFYLDKVEIKGGYVDLVSAVPKGSDKPVLENHKRIYS